MPRWILVVSLALLGLVALLCLLGLRLALRRETRYPPRGSPLDLLDSGDLLFFNARAPISSVIETVGRLLTKGALGTPYCHVSAVYRDVRGLFGPVDALYSFEYDRAAGGAVLYPLRKRAHRSLGRLVCRELARPRPPVDREALDAFVLKSTESTRRGTSRHGTLAWTKSMLERHVLFLCPDPRNGGTCADHVLRFLEAAGLWNPDEGCFCTSVTDLLGDTSSAGLPAFEHPELVKKLKGSNRRTPRSPRGPQRGARAA